MSDNQELDVILLRSFLAVSETLHFTSAAQMRGVTQSTISQHINRLEQAVGASLLHRTTKQVELTPQGMQMVSFAQNIIHAQGMAMDYFRSGTLRVELRLGIAEDMVVSRFPEMLKRFRRLYPHVEVRLTVGLSRELYNLLDAGALDLICTKRKEGDERGIPLWREQLQWLGGGNFDTLAEGAVPLVLFSGNSITRVAAIAAMNKVGRAWRASFMSSNLGALVAAVRSGYGVFAQSGLLVSQEIVPVPASADLPPLPDVDFVMVGATEQLEGASRDLADLIIENIEGLAPPGSRIIAGTSPCGSEAHEVTAI
ncbi:LysR family transcriptional regulator [Komagataeibacter medellinensis]|uniref:LysR family transcriptional regulator n=1 Tax=Komagataeibacter medellinensis TaxID=1177712 RepID=A0ABQ6VTT4_9PROT|nr:LysR substrate-binding domain-containing protein [Komagataeibacter medellinensis]KAB8123606.1 LysR family transcriptional regulator [Komagataeibacter medellinensis]